MPWAKLFIELLIGCIKVVESMLLFFLFFKKNNNSKLVKHVAAVQNYLLQGYTFYREIVVVFEKKIKLDFASRNIFVFAVITLVQVITKCN